MIIAFYLKKELQLKHCNLLSVVIFFIQEKLYVSSFILTFQLNMGSSPSKPSAEVASKRTEAETTKGKPETEITSVKPQTNAASGSRKSEVGTKHHGSEKKSDEDAIDSDCVSEEYDDDITLDEQDRQKKDKMLHGMEETLKTLSKHREHFSDQNGMSQEYQQTSRLLYTLQKELGKISQDKRIILKLRKEEGSHIANIGGIDILLDAVIFIFDKYKKFQEVAESDESVQTSWVVARLLTGYLINFSDQHPEYSKLFVSHGSFIAYSSSVVHQIVTKHSTESDFLVCKSLF